MSKPAKGNKNQRKLLNSQELSLLLYTPPLLNIIPDAPLIVIPQNAIRGSQHSSSQYKRHLDNPDEAMSSRINGSLNCATFEELGREWHFWCFPSAPSEHTFAPALVAALLLLDSWNLDSSSSEEIQKRCRTVVCYTVLWERVYNIVVHSIVDLMRQCEYLFA
ncbi:hypothetical protein J6590_026915 [Homalodisca vitripennis]|nr:hypothetical protein J6590_026915 [Homalodisca vitripennis]